MTHAVRSFRSVVTLALLGGAVSVPSDSELRLTVSARRTCSGGGHVAGTARLWFNGKPADSGPARDAGSRLAARINVTDRNYFLRGNFALGATPGSSALAVDTFVNSSKSCAAPDGRPFTLFGTWTTTLP